jgi:hypothetical protein
LAILFVVWRAQFERSGLQPEILATFSDGPAGIRNTSAVERAIRKHPPLARFERNDASLQGAGIPAIRRLTVWPFTSLPKLPTPS